MEFITPARLKPGDKVGIVSPSAGLASVYPWVYELGISRLREVFHLEPITFPNTLKSPEYLEKNPQARAEDINAAFADPSINAIIATCGGEDEIRILPFLNWDIIKSNPKRFFGYSDNTNLHLGLWNCGIVSYYGGSLLTQFAMQDEMHDFSVAYLKKAFFENKMGKLTSASERTDIDLDWADKTNLMKSRSMFKSDPWVWHNKKNNLIQGRLWGGCLEVLELHLGFKRYLPPIEQLENCILYLETSEELPSSDFVYRFMATLAEREMLQKFQALLFGYPKAEFLGKHPPEGKQAYILNQQLAIKKALTDYHCNVLVVFNMNFGHTDPQLIIPNGGMITIDCAKESIFCD